MIRLENTYSNDSHDIRKHFKMIKERFGGVRKLGVDRFQLLRRCFNPSIGELVALAQIIGENSQGYDFYLFSFILTDLFTSSPLLVMMSWQLVMSLPRRSSKRLMMLESLFLSCLYQESLILIVSLFIFLQPI
jgi:hypothetical protein